MAPVSRRIEAGAGAKPGQLTADFASAALKGSVTCAMRCAGWLLSDCGPTSSDHARDLTRSEVVATLNALATARPILVWPDDKRQPARAYRTSGTATGLAVGLIGHQSIEVFTGGELGRLRPYLATNRLRFFVADRGRS